MSGSTPNKSGKRRPIDGLSLLPDGVLILILSFLGVKKAAVTSVLSKRWKFLWSQLPKLVFKEEGNDTEKIRQFVSMVNRTLSIRDGFHLETLHVYLTFDLSLAPDIDSWVDFVSQSKTQDFSLDLMARGENDLYVTPDTMYLNPSLMRLSLWGCIMNTTRTIEWQSLTYLDLNHTAIPQHLIDIVLSGCPVLHTLLLVECWGFDSLKASSGCLYHLQVHDNEAEENEPLLVISAPSVHVLDILFHAEDRILELTNMKSLVMAEVEFTEYLFINSEDCMNAAKEFYENTDRANELSVGCNCFKAISESVVLGWKIPCSKRRILTINAVSEDEHVITGVIALLESSPFLETLTIEGFGAQGESWDAAAKDYLDCELLHLKTVKFIEFSDPIFEGEPMLTVARAILKKAMNLEEMVVRVRFSDMSDYVKISRALLACPRSSNKAVIHLEGFED